MSNITDILAYYPILCSVIKNLTTRDLLHLASAAKLIAEICHLGHVSFDDLKRYTICDGSGAWAKWTWYSRRNGSTYKYREATIRGMYIESDEHSILLTTLGTLVRAELDYTTCFRMFSRDPLFRSSKGKCLQLDPQPCSKCKIMVCEVNGHPFCQRKPVSELTVAKRLVVRLIGPFGIKLGQEISKRTRKKPILQDFGASVGRAKMWSIYSHKKGSGDATV